MRKKPYVRKQPEPVEVNYRMGYVGTVSVIGAEDGESTPALSRRQRRLGAVRSISERPTTSVLDGYEQEVRGENPEG